MILSKEREECKGCAGGSYSDFCMVPRLEEVYKGEMINSCPCINCLVKVTCIDMCEERINLTAKKKWRII